MTTPRIKQLEIFDRFDENYEALSSCSGGSTEFKVCHYYTMKELKCIIITLKGGGYDIM